MTAEKTKDEALFYVATIMEYTARATNNEISYIADTIGRYGMRKIYESVKVSHCFQFAQVSAELIQQHGIGIGSKEPDLSHVPVTTIGAAYANYVIEHQPNGSEFIGDLFLLLRSLEKTDELKVSVAAQNVLNRYRPAFQKLAE